MVFRFACSVGARLRWFRGVLVRVQVLLSVAGWCRV